MSFVYDNTDLYLDKSNLRAPRNVLVEWTAEDTALIKSALLDIRTALNARDPMALAYGTTGDGVVDDTAELQDAIDNTQGRRLRLTKAKYLVSSTLTITDTATHIVGDYGARNSAGGTEILYTGLGPCIQIGTDNLHDWNANDYDGPQDHIFENIAISHGIPNSSLASNPGGGSVYKANAYGIWDWRGGGVILNHVRLERFEANFVGIQSDINFFQYIQSHYSKYGLYLGPRSDQNSIYDLYSFLCDRAVTIDGAKQTRIVNTQIVGCGTSTASAIEIRQGSSAVRIESSWFEHLGGTGYAGTDQQSFVSAGEVAGYGSGGNITTPGGTPTTSSVNGCLIDAPFVITPTAGNVGHTKYVATVGKCQSFELRSPHTQAGSSLANFDSMVNVPAAQTPTSSDTQIYITPTESSTFSKLYLNSGAGTPAVNVLSTGSNGMRFFTSGRHSFSAIGAVAGAEEFRISQEGQAGNIFIECPTYASSGATGQTVRLRTARSLQTATVSTSPAAGTWERGDRVWVTDPAEGSHPDWVCTSSGTPGTWRRSGLVAGSSGILAIPFAFAFASEASASLTANQDNYNPGSLVNTSMLVLTSTGAVNITGIVSALNGKVLHIYNNGANNITLTHQDVASTAANRIIGTAGANVVLTPNRGALLYYSPSITRWLVLLDNL